MPMFNSNLLNYERAENTAIPVDNEKTFYPKKLTIIVEPLERSLDEPIEVRTDLKNEEIKAQDIN